MTNEVTVQVITPKELFEKIVPFTEWDDEKWEDMMLEELKENKPLMIHKKGKTLRINPGAMKQYFTDKAAQKREDEAFGKQARKTNKKENKG